MRCSGSKGLLGDFDSPAMEMPTPPKRSYSAGRRCAFETGLLDGCEDAELRQHMLTVPKQGKRNDNVAIRRPRLLRGYRQTSRNPPANRSTLTWGNSNMKPTLWLLLGLIVGASLGWYVHGLSEQDVRASANFTFTDKLADRQVPYLSAKGSWRGDNLANKINTVHIVCDPSNCDLYQADVMSLGGGAYLSLYNTTFRITKVDAQSVVAEPNLPELCVRQTLTFDRVAKAVTIVRTKISREDACSVVQDEPLRLVLGEPLR